MSKITEDEILDLVDHLVEGSKEAFCDIAYGTPFYTDEAMHISEQFGEQLRGSIETFIYGLAEELNQKGESNE